MNTGKIYPSYWKYSYWNKISYRILGKGKVKRDIKFSNNWLKLNKSRIQG